MVKQSDIDNLISELHSISSKVAEFNNNDQNLFHIISMDHMEIKHSNLLGWLLDVNGSHELKDAFLKNLMLQIIPIYNRNCNKVNTKPLPSSVSENNWLDSAVLREYKNIDILFQDNTNNLNLIIENKIYSSEHSNQLERYEKIVNFEYPDETNTNIFIYLTLYGEEARSKTWITLTYQNVISALYKTIYSVSNLNAKTTIILFDYIYLLKELIGMDDDEKQKIATEIWNKHKEAIEFIENNRFKPEKEIMLEFKRLCNTETDEDGFLFDEKYSDSVHIRFKTSKMNRFVSENEIDNENSIWNSNQKYYYEITVDFKKNHMVFGQLSFKLNNCSETDQKKINSLTKEKDGDAWSIKKFHFDYMQQRFANHLDEYTPEEVKQECKNVFNSYLSQITIFESSLRN